MSVVGRLKRQWGIQGRAPGARAPPSDQRAPPYGASIPDAHLYFYSETTLSLPSCRQNVEAMKWIAKRKV